MQLYSLRRILGFSLSLLALVPALLAAWLLTRASTSSVEEMAQGLLTQVAERIQLATEDHMRQAHVILNGLVSVRMTPAEEAQAREWLRHPAHFEAMAFALVHQTQDVPSVYLGTLLGAYLGMEATPEGVRSRAVKPTGSAGSSFFRAGRGARAAACLRNGQLRTANTGLVRRCRRRQGSGLLAGSRFYGEPPAVRQPVTARV